MTETQELEVAIIGSGCAGHTAAIYAARADLSPMVFEGKEPGGQLSLTTIVENYPGFPDGVGGFDLIYSMKQQAMKFGASYEMQEIVKADLSKRPFSLETNEGKNYLAKTLIIASGARAKLLGIPREKDLFGKGVSTCATCDGALFRDKKIVVVGGGDTAMEDSLFLTRFAAELHLVHRRDTLRASQIMQKRVLGNPKVTIHWNTQVSQIRTNEEGVFAGLELIQHPKGNPAQHLAEAGSLEAAGVTKTDFDCDGLFLAIGHIPNIEFLEGQLPTNGEGYIVPHQKEEHCKTADVFTAIPGVYCAGDVVDWQFQQAITAAGMGCKAAMAAEEFLSHEEG